MGPKRPVHALTIDVEDYFMASAFEPYVPKTDWEHHEQRVCRNTEKILGLCEEHKVQGTFFILGWVAEQYPKLVRAIAEQGHEVACHGYDHRLIYHQTPQEFRQDIRKAKKLLEDAAGTPVLGYRAPSFSITQESLWALPIIKEEGFSYDSSLLPAPHARGGIPQAETRPHQREGLALLPMSTVRWGEYSFPFSGGGYFRLFPYRFIQWAIQKNYQQGLPTIIYLHPWELDPQQPRLPARGIDRFKHYLNLSATEPKLKRLLRDFSFTTAKNVLASYGLL